MDTQYNALFITEVDGRFIPAVKQLDLAQLADYDTIIKVSYSSVNYKDALSASGNKGVTKKYPHVPGIDAAGTVVSCKTGAFKPGQHVLVTGFDLGMDTWGGYGQYISIPAAWALPLPKGLSLMEAMAFGTAGLTAGLSVFQLVNAGITPQKGPVAVSGATGGVGSIATAILAKLGYQVTAISGKNDEDYLLQTLGAMQVINRNDFTDAYNSKALSKPLFAAGIDTVGGEVLSGIIKATQYGGTVTCCGMVASPELQTSIFPFIIRNVCLAGIDSVQTPMNLRTQVWQLLATHWKPANLGSMVQLITLPQLAQKLTGVLHGQARGRYVLQHQD